MFKILYGDLENVIGVSAYEAATTVGLSNETEVTEVIFMIKRTSKDLDEDAKISKTLGSGIELITIDGCKYFYVSFVDADWANLPVGKNYQMMFGVKKAGDTKYRELLFQDYDLEVTQDYIRG